MIDLERHGRVHLVRISHGGANVLDLELCDELVATLDRLRRSEAGAVVLTGSGRSFSAGVDLKRVLAGGADYVRAFLPALCRAAHRVFAYPRPLVAAINGHAIAGGCLIACAADRRWMVEAEAGIGVPELQVGVPFPAAALEILRYTAGEAGAQRLVTSGRILSPKQAVAAGLVDDLAPAAELVERALSEAAALAEIPAVSFELTKRQLRAPALARLAAEAEAIDAEIVEAWSRPEILAAVGAYVERTFGRRGG